MEAIIVIETFATKFPLDLVPCMANVFKYTLRAPFKNALLKDLKKARQYLNRAINKLEGKNDDWNFYDLKPQKSKPIFITPDAPSDVSDTINEEIKTQCNYTYTSGELHKKW